MLKTIIKFKTGKLRRLFPAAAVLAAVLAALFGFFPASARAAPSPKPDSQLPSEVLVGQVEIKLQAPAGLERVDGLDPAADEFTASLVERFKLRVLAVYAEPEAFRQFAAGLLRKEPRRIPRLAMITAPVRMDRKSYAAKDVAKEKRRFREWFSLAVNTRPLAWVFGRKANKKLSEKLGVDVKFSYTIGPETRRFDERERSVSFSVLAGMELFGARSDFFLTASMLNVEDKLVFLSWVEPAQEMAAVTAARRTSLSWLEEMASANQAVLGTFEDEPDPVI
ncbi:MAG: hypothetical protein LBK52_03510 [Deltaproteobacteria bacterium]|nr:hypothetical protein [Deltaproteobacteria bacterium]